MKHLFTRILVGISLLTLTLSMAGVTQVSAAGKNNSMLTQWLNPDGTLNLASGYNGNLDISNYNISIDPARGPIFRPLMSPGIWSALGTTPLNNDVRAIAINGTDVYVGGGFTNAGGNANADKIAKWNGTSWSALGTGLNGAVWTIAISGTDVYAGGIFYDAGGNPNADRIAKWNGTSWSALGTGLNSHVDAIAISGTDVYAGGGFTNAGGAPNADYIAKWDGTSWSALTLPLNYFVWAIAISGTDVYAGGGFTNAGGNPNADNIAKWDGTSWSALGTGLNGRVFAIAISGTDVYAGGSFTNAGGNPKADNIAKWDGTSWSALGTTPLQGEVHAIAMNSTDMYLGGSFANAGGDPNADRIAKWNGTSWSALGTMPFLINSIVDTIAISGTTVYAGGPFIDAGGDANADYIARFVPTTTLTAYSNAAQDGTIVESSENSSVGGGANSTSNTFALGDNAAKAQYRDILSFTTGSLPDNATITSVILKVKQQAIVGAGDPVSIFQGFMVDMKNGLIGTLATLQTTDFEAAAVGPYGPFMTVPVSSVYSINLTAGKNNINKLATNSGLTQIRLRFKLGDNDDAVANYLSLHSGDAVTAADRPQLVITYTVP